MKCICLLCCLLATSFANAQEGKKYTLKGVVTYYFNPNYGDKPDTGAKAYVLTEAQARAMRISTDTFSSYQLAYLQFTNGNLLIKPEKKLTAADKDIKAKLASLSDSLTKQQFRLENAKTPYLTVDGSGIFSKNVLPGKYVILLKSAHRKNATPAEITGQVDIRGVEIKEEDFELPVRFNGGY